MDLNNRFLIFRKHLKLNQAQIAESLGVGQTSISKYEKGDSVPEQTLIILELKYNLNKEWFRTGKGTMLLLNEYKKPDAGYNIIEDPLLNLNINQQQISDPMTIETINKMLDIISRQQDDIHIANLNVKKAMENQSNLINMIPGGNQVRKKASGDN